MMKPFKEVENEQKDNIHVKDDRIFLNGSYQVNVRCFDKIPDFKGLLWLSIKRYDKDAIHDWRDIQEIKNLIAGDEREAVEIYPPESELIDTCNQYHIYVLPEGERTGLGFKTGRCVVEGHDNRHGGTRQRPFKNKPKDCLTIEEANELLKGEKDGKLSRR